jgi:hypothetical protein
MAAKWVGAALAASCVFMVSEAHAGWPGPEMITSRAGADAYFWSAKQLGSTFGIVPFLRYEIAAQVFLDASLPVAANIDGADGKTRFGMGNPTLGAHYASASEDVTWYVGGRASIPLVRLMDDNTQSVASALGGLSTALYDLHLWTDYLPVVGFGGLEARVATPLFVRAELAPGFLIPMRDAEKLEFMYQLRAELEGRSEAGWGGGGALQFVHLPGFDGDNAQASLEGFGSYDNGSLFARLGLLLALDEPLGFGFDKGKVATLHGRIGGYL